MGSIETLNFYIFIRQILQDLFHIITKIKPLPLKY